MGYRLQFTRDMEGLMRFYFWRYGDVFAAEADSRSDLEDAFEYPRGPLGEGYGSIIGTDLGPTIKTIQDRIGQIDVELAAPRGPGYPIPGYPHGPDSLEQERENLSDLLERLEAEHEYPGSTLSVQVVQSLNT